MCRHLARIGPPRTLTELLVDPAHSLYRQSWAPRRQQHGTVNADGFGIGWYPPEDSGGIPVRYRRAVPIWADPNLAGLTRVLQAGAVLAAVRDATCGTSYDEAAVAPYCSGSWLFSHNGAVSDWERLPDEAALGLSASTLLSMEARCDAALLWAAVHARLADMEPPGEALSAVVRQTAAARPDARLNLLLTDGETIAATCWGDTLWYRADEDGVLVASEPSDDGDGWCEVPDHSLLLATATTVRTTSLSPSPPPPLSVPRLATTERNLTS